MTRVLEIRKMRGISGAELARATGLHPTTISKYELGDRDIRTEKAEKIAQALGVPIHEIYREVGAPIPEIGSSHIPHTGVIPALPPSRDTLAQAGVDVPVHPATSMWGQGKFVLQIDHQATTEFAPRPRGLVGANVFAFYVANDCMFPWRKPGELVYCHRTREPQVGSHVVVLLKEKHPVGGHSSYLATLTDRDGDRLTLSMYKHPDPVEIPLSEVKSVYGVIEWQDAFGVA